MELPPILSPRFDTIPQDLKDLGQWVCWSAVWDPAKGKYNKIPKNARTGANASSTNPATWSGYEVAKAAYERDPKKYAGIGFVLCADDPYCGVDLDHVITTDAEGNKVLSASAASIVASLDTYAEVSPSGTGIRLFAVGKLPPGQHKRGGTEAYDTGRYLTVTGRRWSMAPETINERQAEIDRFHAEAFPEEKPKEARPNRSRIEITDTELLSVAFKAKNGEKIAALYNGNRSGYIGESEADFALASALAFYTGDDPARLDRLMRGSGLVRAKWDDMRGGETWLMADIRRAIAKCPDFYQPSVAFDPEGVPKKRANAAPRPKLETDPEFGGGPDDPDNLPVVVITDRQDRDISADAWRAIHLANTPPRLFARSMGAACLARDAETGRVAVQEVNEERMLYLLRRVANFVTVRQTKNGPIRTNTPPPLRIARDMRLDNDQVGALPVLRGVVNAPVVGPDGAILAKPGYHPSARLYVATEGLPLNIPDAPTKEDAQAAYDRLFGEEGVFGEFPYASDTDRAHAAALLFTLFLRSYIGGNVPMSLCEAPEKGTGKTLNMESIVSVFEPSTSARPAPTTGTREQAQVEWSKALTSALRDSPSVLFYDNIQGVLASSSLEALITSTSYTDRILGTAEQVTFNTDTLTVVGTSNNPEISEDMARRVNVIRLDAQMERPTDRKDFRIPDLKKHVKENRGAIIGDVLTILSAWLRAGAVPGKAHKASFERWSSVLSGVFDFLEVSGFLEKEAGFAAPVDPEKAKWAMFAASVFMAHKSEPKRAREILVEAIEAEILTATYTIDSHTKEVNVHNEASAAKSLGRLLIKQKDRVFNGLKLVSKPNKDKIIEYAFVPTEPQSPEGPRQSAPPVDAAPIRAFVAARCTLKPSARVSEYDLLQAYNAWAKGSGETATYYPTLFHSVIKAINGVTVNAIGNEYHFVGIAPIPAHASGSVFDDPFDPERERVTFYEEGEIG